MKILYASNICSNKEFEKIYKICQNNKPLQSIQKFNRLVCEGLVEQENVELEVITSAPVNRKMCKKIMWWQKKEKENNIKYNYCFMINLPIIKFISLFFSSTITSLKWCIKNRNEKGKYVIYDSYCPIIANMAAIIGNLFKVKIIALYTDLPQYMDANKKRRKGLKDVLKVIYQSFNNLSNNIAKGYILLTEQMNEVVNLKSKPYVVIEGLIDKNIIIDDEEKYKEFTIMYAGGLYEKFGVYNLIEAVEQIDNKDIKLKLYGNGELEELLNTKYRNNCKINYGGVLRNQDIVKEEKRATILVNPRFTNEEYTKYSFPSKNMEYMASRYTSINN